MSTPGIIAATFGWDQSEVKDYRYQDTRTSQAIYAVGDRYFAVGKRAPKDVVGGPWRPHADQVFAQRENTILWVSEAS